MTRAGDKRTRKAGSGQSPARTSARPIVRSSGPPSVLGYGDLGISLILIFPLFLAYEIGLLLEPLGGNGVDFVSRYLLEWLDYDRTNFLYVHLGLAAAFLMFTLYMRNKGVFTLRVAPPMLLESAIYALTMGSFIVFVMDRLLGFSLSISLGHAVVASLGAGVHEELVFRLGLMAGSAYVLKQIGVKHTVAVVLSLAGSAVLFSLAHHVGPAGDDWQLEVLTYRALAGTMLGLIFYYRSLAHAVYTHFMYDVYVMVIRG